MLSVLSTLIARKNQTRVWLLHKHYPFVPIVMQNVLLNVLLFLESRYPGKCLFVFKSSYEMLSYTEHTVCTALPHRLVLTEETCWL